MLPYFIFFIVNPLLSFIPDSKLPRMLSIYQTDFADFGGCINRFLLFSLIFCFGHIPKTKLATHQFFNVCYALLYHMSPATKWRILLCGEWCSDAVNTGSVVCAERQIKTTTMTSIHHCTAVAKLTFQQMWYWLKSFIMYWVMPVSDIK